MNPQGTTLPVDDPILIFALAMITFLVAPLVLQRVRLPGIVGIIFVGVAIGPDGIGLFELDDTFDLLGTIGLVYLMFVAGLEINLNRFIEYKDRSMVFGLLSFVIPQTVGTIVGYYVLDLSLAAALLFASIFASHTLLAYPIINRLGIASTESVTATIGGTIITDTLALLVLAIVIASTEGEIGPAFWLELTISLTVFFVGIWLAVPRIGRWFFRTVDQESYYEFLFVMAVLFVCAYLAELAGIEHIVGAFLAGLVLNRLIPQSGPLMNRIEFVGNALFIPFFLLWVGMHVDLEAITAGPDTLVIAGALIGMVLVTKSAAAWLTARVYGYDTDQTMTMFGLSVGQAAAALAIVLIGFDAGLFDENMLNGVILMMLAVSVLSPAIVDRYGRKVVRAAEQVEYDPSEAPRRVMVPFSPHSQYREELLDLALLVRDGDSPEPLYTLSVAKPGRDVETDAEIAEIEAVLEATEAYTSGAEVPVQSQTRVERNVATGIVRAVTENRITTLIIGWDGAASRRQRVFGDVIDRVLTRTKQLVLVSHIRQPINTTTEIVCILPRGIDHNEGFFEVVHTIEHVAEQTGASIRGLVVDANPEKFERLFGMVDPEVPAEFEAVDDWKALLDVLRDEVENDDLVMAMSARRGTMGWHTELQTLPKSISTLTDGNFVVVYPASGERADDRQFLQFK